MSDRSGKYSSPVRIIRLQQETEQNQHSVTIPTIEQLCDKTILIVIRPGTEPKHSSL
jgi:hypothetical protein